MDAINVGMKRTDFSSPEIAVGVGIFTIALAILLGPLASPPVFDWVRHTTSEQAAQGLGGAWAMRFGFVGYGLGVLIAAILARQLNMIVRICLGAFGLGLVGTAIWSNMPITNDVPPDMFEDWLHSVASGIVGTAFALMCFAQLALVPQRWRNPLAWMGLIAAIAIPLAMTGFPDVKGVLQRLMFALSAVVVLGLLRTFRSNQD